MASRSGVRRFEEVGELFDSGRTVPELQALYGVKRDTIIEHLTAYVHAGHTIDGTRLRYEARTATGRLYDAFELLDDGAAGNAAF